MENILKEQGYVKKRDNFTLKNANETWLLRIKEYGNRIIIKGLMVFAEKLADIPEVTCEEPCENYEHILNAKIREIVSKTGWLDTPDFAFRDDPSGELVISPFYAILDSSIYPAIRFTFSTKTKRMAKCFLRLHKILVKAYLVMKAECTAKKHERVI